MNSIKNSAQTAAVRASVTVGMPVGNWVDAAVLHHNCITPRPAALLAAVRTPDFHQGYVGTGDAAPPRGVPR